MFKQIFQRFLKQFFLANGRGPGTPAEWMSIQDDAVRYLNKTKGAPSIKKEPWHQGWTPKVIEGGKPKKGIESLMESGEVQLGTAPKTKKSRLDWYKEAANKKRYSDDFYKGPNITKEEWVSKKKQENKDAIRRFQEKTKKDEPDKFYAGGIAPLVGEPSYAANFYDDRTPYKVGKIVKGVKKLLKKKKLKKDRVATADELEDYIEILDPTGETGVVEEGMTVRELDKMVAEQKAYEAEMYRQYKRGDLDPTPGDKSPARKRFLEKKLEDMEMSGDKRLMTIDEIEELSSFDLGTEMDEAIDRLPNFLGGRIGMAGGALVKGGRWFLKSLHDTKKQLMQLDIPLAKKQELMKQADDAIKQIEGGAPIPEQILQHIRKDPKFKSVSQGPRATDPDLAEMEEIILEYGKKHAEGGRIGYSGGGKAGLPAVTMGTPQMNMQGPPMPAGPQPAGISGADLQLNQMNLMQQDPWMQNQMKQGIGGTPQYKGQLRMPFGKGKKVDLSKRRFLKGAGFGLGALSMLPFVGKFFKPAAKAVGKFKGTPNLVVDITNTPNMPEWYIPLIKKVLNKGDEVTDTAATAERQRVHRDILPDGDEVTVTQNIDNQTIDVSVANPKNNYISASGAGESPYTIQYSKGKVIEEGKYKGQKEPDTLQVDEPYTAQVGPDTKDVEIEFDVMDYNPKAEVHDTSVLETYATGKKVKPRGTGEIRDPYEGFSPDLKADDYAKGGVAHLLGE